MHALMRWLSVCPSVAIWTTVCLKHASVMFCQKQCADDRCMCVGGRQGKLPVTAFEVYDFATSRWRSLPDIPTKRVFALYAHSDNHIFSVGGLHQDVQQGFSDVTEVFDLDSGLFKFLVHMFSLSLSRGSWTNNLEKTSNLYICTTVVVLETWVSLETRFSKSWFWTWNILVLVLDFWLFFGHKISVSKWRQTFVGRSHHSLFYQSSLCVDRWIIEWWSVISWSVDHHFHDRTLLYYVSNDFFYPVSHILNKLNDKTDLLWCATFRRRHQLPTSALGIQFKLAIIVCRSLNGTAPHYLAADLRRLSDMPSRRRLRALLTDQLDVRQSQCSTVGDRAFAVAGARLWNSLPHDIIASDALSRFCRELKTFLFRQSYPSVLF